jgi:hypothetical protein
MEAYGMASAVCEIISISARYSSAQRYSYMVSSVIIDCK